MPEGLNPEAPTGAEGIAPDAGTEPAAAEDPNAKLIEDYRKRQAGAERARQEAERQRDDLKRQLEAALSSKTAAPATGEQGPDLEAIKRELKADFDQRVAKARAEALGEALDARFPVARSKFPEVTDAVKLAELEALFAEPTAPPTPLGNNQQRTAGTKRIEDMTSAELQAYMKSLDPSVMGLSRD